jgi:hypothetical protein
MDPELTILGLWSVAWVASQLRVIIEVPRVVYA